VSLLDDIIDGASDDAVSTSNLLRKVQVAAARLGAEDVVTWTRNELNGYTSIEALPPYRAAQYVTVEGVFSGPMSSMAIHSLPRPTDDQSDWTMWFQAIFVQPVAELEGLAASEKAAQSEWPPAVVKKYEQTGAFSLSLHGLFRVHQKVSPQMLRGLIDSIRNAALDFAVALQVANPEAGSVGGPTVQSDSAVASVVTNYYVTNTITGHGNNVAAGERISQTSSVTVGDREGLQAELTALGLDEAAIEEFTAALDADGSVEGPQVRSFLDRVKTGAINVTTDVATRVVTGQLTTLGLEYLDKL